MKTTEENNRMIAEFMGASGFDMLGEKVEPRYHTSWDWLMPVVKKIETDVLDGDISISIDGDNCTLSSISYTIHCHATLNSKIESTYQAVVEFIEWYNEQK